jgi:hypothetical protein
MFIAGSAAGAIGETMIKLAPVLLAALALAGCVTASPRERVRSELLSAGLKPRMADCLADRLVDRLSVGELRQLGRAAKLPRKDVGNMSINELADRLAAVGDPHIVSVVTSAGLGCAIAS